MKAVYILKHVIVSAQFMIIITVGSVVTLFGFDQ